MIDIEQEHMYKKLKEFFLFIGTSRNSFFDGVFVSLIIDLACPTTYVTMTWPINYGIIVDFLTQTYSYNGWEGGEEMQ